MTLIQVNISFIGSENPLNTNENSLKISLSAVKFRSHCREVPRNFARTYADCSEISLSIGLAKYR